LPLATTGNRTAVVRVPLKHQDDTVVQSGRRDEEQQIASGRPSSTPFAVVGVVALVIWLIAAVFAAVAFVVIWLV
jgi:hypothetical protein